MKFNSIMKKLPENLNQVLSLMTAFNELSIGIANGWVAPTLNSLSSPNGELYITMEESSWIASLENIGTIPGSILTAFILDIVGRKILLTLTAFIFFSMWAVMIFTRSVPILCLMRLLFGVFVGINSGTNAAYLAENSTPRMRGVFGAVTGTFYCNGLLAEFIIATYFSYTATLIINAVITFFAFLSVFWIKEPVQFLLMKGKYTQAEKNFAWLHGGSRKDERIRSEFEKIKSNVQSENSKKLSFKKVITYPANYKSLFIVVTIYSLAGLTGIFPAMSYASMAFTSSDILTSNEFTILFGIGQVLAMVPSSLLVGQLNRRSIILISFSLITLSHAVSAVLYYVNFRIVPIPYFSWLIFTSITLFASVFAFVFPALFLIRSELFPLSVKALGGCSSIIAYNATNFLTTKMFLFISYCWGIEANFLLFCILALSTVLFVYFFLPETRNKSLIEIQEILEKSK